MVGQCNITGARYVDTCRWLETGVCVYMGFSVVPLPMTQHRGKLFWHYRFRFQIFQ